LLWKGYVMERKERRHHTRVGSLPAMGQTFWKSA
jgi:hypothetical protein